MSFEEDEGSKFVPYLWQLSEQTANPGLYTFVAFESGGSQWLAAAFSSTNLASTSQLIIFRNDSFSCASGVNCTTTWTLVQRILSYGHLSVSQVRSITEIAGFWPLSLTLIQIQGTDGTPYILLTENLGLRMFKLEVSRFC